MTKWRPYTLEQLNNYLGRANAELGQEALRKFERFRITPFRAKTHDPAGWELEEYWVFLRDGNHALVFDDDWTCMFSAIIFEGKYINTNMLYDHVQLEEAILDFPENCRPDDAGGQ